MFLIEVFMDSREDALLFTLGIFLATAVCAVIPLMASLGHATRSLETNSECVNVRCIASLNGTLVIIVSGEYVFSQSPLFLCTVTPIVVSSESARRSLTAHRLCGWRKEGRGEIITAQMLP